MATHLRNAYPVDAHQWTDLDNPPPELNILDVGFGGLEGWPVYITDWIIRDDNSALIEVVSAVDFANDYTII